MIIKNIRWNDNILENIYLSLEEIANIEFQKRLWENKIPNMASSYIEAICSLFDDCFFDTFIDDYLERIEVSEEFKELVKELRIKLNSFDGSEMPHRKIFKHPQWIDITKIAHEVISLWPENLGSVVN